ncbi:MAG: thioredoxin family protein [Pirellulaceae bacterium]
MPFEPVYREVTLTREDIEQLPGPTLLEFGANWCGICGGFAPQLQSLLDGFPEVRHNIVEDGRGKVLGRSFRVKLWPTLVFLRDGKVVDQMARPSPDAAHAGLAAITAEQSGSQTLS